MSFINAQRLADAALSGIKKITSKTNMLTQSKLERVPIKDEFTHSPIVSSARNRILKIKNAIKNLATKSDARCVKKYSKEYQKMIQNTQLNYDPLSPPIQFAMPDILNGLNVFKISDIQPLKATQVFDGEMFDTNIFKKTLDETGKVEIIFPKTNKFTPAVAKNAEISADTPDLGKAVSMKQTLEYGAKIGWSNDKIARDVMQNFYDGHGNTLDGVEMFFEKLPNGKTKIKIKGKGIYKHTQLENTGCSEKSQNLANAGGFGEGAKVLSNSLIASKKTDNVKYGSSNWILEYFGSEKNQDGYQMLMSKTSMTEDPLNGNFLEFETSDDDLVNSIIKSANYFKHSKNPDFSEFDFQKNNFGFSILDKDNSGNFYLTQRFEYKIGENWDNKLENIKVVFDEKPNPEEFKTITGEDFKVARDRLPIQPNEISALTHYFVLKNMSDDEITSAILSTKDFWEKITFSKEKLAIGEFLNGLIKAAKARKIGIDIESEKFVAATNTNQTIVDTLKSYGYKFVPKEMVDIGFPKSEDIFHFLSVHKPIVPNEVEIQKLKLLEESMVETYKKINTAFFNKLSKINITLDTSKRKEIANLLSEICDTTTIEKLMPDCKFKINDLCKQIKEMDLEKRIKLIETLNLNEKDAFFGKWTIASKLVSLVGNKNICSILKIDDNPDDCLLKLELEKKSIRELLEIINITNSEFNIDTNVLKKEFLEYFKEYEIENKINNLLNEEKITIKNLKDIIPDFDIKIDSYALSKEISNLSDDEMQILANKISEHFKNELNRLAVDNNKDKLYELIEEIWLKASNCFELNTQERFRTLRDFSLITKDDLKKPRYLFDRFNQIANRTLGESIADIPKREYYGHWIDKSYFDSAEFYDMYATWLHEICHKGGGDGTAEFTYILTDLLKIVAGSNTASKEANNRITAIAKVYDELCNQN